jgi:large repetitive protein
LTAIVLAGTTPVGSGLVTFSSGATSIGAGSLNAQGVATLAITSLQVGNNNITASYTASQNDAASTSSAVTVPVAAAPTTTTLTASASSITVGQSVTLTAIVLAGTTPVGSGLVTFSSGATSIGAAQLNAAGIATLNTMLLPVGNDNIIASYAASQNDAASTSPAVIVTVTTTTGPPTTVPSYSMTASPTSVSIVRGQTGLTTVTITPANGYSGMLTLNCGNLPAYATCTFTQNTVQLTGNNQPVQVGLTIATNIEQAKLTPPTPTPFSPVFPAMVFWLPAGFGAACKRKRSPKRRRWLEFCLLLAATGAMAAGMLGCAGGTYWKTPIGTSNISVLATPASGNVQALTLTLTITQ